MRIAVTGSTGMVAGTLIPLAEANGHQVVRIIRSQPRDNNQIQWDPAAGKLDPAALSGTDVVVHLAGENIGEGRWNAAKKQSIRDSRVQSTALLANTIANMAQPPQALICASAIGYYGDRGEEVLTEASAAGSGFLADVCQAWEQAADPCRSRCRVVHCRLGMVLSRRGGALKSMLLPFQLGVGGIMGSGKQYWSWITLEDAARVFLWAIENSSVQGVINATAPQPVTNGEFTKAMGSVLHRPTILPMPGFMASLALGEMADALILPSQRVLPNILREHGFEFKHPEIQSALAAAITN